MKIIRIVLDFRGLFSLNMNSLFYLQWETTGGVIQNMETKSTEHKVCQCLKFCRCLKMALLLYKCYLTHRKMLGCFVDLTGITAHTCKLSGPNLSAKKQTLWIIGILLQLLRSITCLYAV